MAKMKKINQENIREELRDKLLEEVGITDEPVNNNENQHEDDESNINRIS